MLIGPLRSLRFERERALLSQVQLASLAHVSRSTVIHLEDGDRCFPPTAVKLARALQIPVEDLISKPPRQHPTSWAPIVVAA